MLRNAEIKRSGRKENFNHADFSKFQISENLSDAWIPAVIPNGKSGIFIIYFFLIYLYPFYAWGPKWLHNT